jgi:hypothetical protein
MLNSAVDPGSLTDPTIKRVDWGPVVMNGVMREAGRILRQDGTAQTFFDKNLLTRCLAAFEAKKAQLLADHTASELPACISRSKSWSVNLKRIDQEGSRQSSMFA